MGTLFTEEGVELWKDWAHGRSPQVVAMRELLRLREPTLFVDVHQHERPTSIFIPCGLKTVADVERHQRPIRAAYDALAAAGIPHDRLFGPYIANRPDLNASTNWAFTRLGSLQYLVEIDCGYRPWSSTSIPAENTTPLSKSQIVMSVWYIATAMLLALIADT